MKRQGGFFYPGKTGHISSDNQPLRVLVVEIQSKTKTNFFN